MFKSIVAATAVFASALFAHGANVDSVSTQMGTLVVDGSTYTATSLEYKASPSNNSAPYRTGAGWYAGLKLTWNSNSQNATSTKAKVEDDGGVNAIGEYTVYNNGDKTPSGKGLKNAITSSGTLFNKKYWMSTTEWYIYVTPEFMYSLNGEDYSATLTIGGNTYTITVPHDIVLNDGSHQWYPAVGLLGSKVYGEAQYLADQITLDNYTTVKFLSDPSGLDFPDGKFKAGAQGEDGKWIVELNHQHSWSFPVSADGATLTATCGSEGCPYETTTVSLALSSGNKTYDNKAITASADFDEYFEDIFPGATTTISIIKDEASVETIKDAGTYTVTMTVTGLGDEQSYTLSRTVTISKVVITDAMLSFTPANQTYNGTEQTVTPSVNANGLAATFEVDTGTSTTSATERGTYSVTVTGIGNFEGTATATWSIVNTTGGGSTVTESATGSMTASGNDFTLSDSSKLEYDAENAVWYAGITIKWPKESSSPAIGDGHAYYVKPESMQMIIDGTAYTGKEIVDLEANYEAGILDADVNGGSYTYYSGLSRKTKNFTYLDTTTWKVRITPDLIDAALAEAKTELVYTMTAGAIIWGNDTEGDPDGVAFQDYTITIPIDENLKLYDQYGNQAYPALPYVAQIDGKKYLSLEDALTASESGQTVTLIAQDDYDGEYEILEGVTVELGAFGSSDATYVLSLGSVLTSDAKCSVSTSETGYGVERSGEGPYTYSVVMQHVHNWEVVVNGSVLTATCNAEACPLDVTEYSMRLFTGVKSGATEDVDGKVYDGESMSRKAEFGDGFTDVFPNVETQISVTKGGESVDTINDVGEYVVTMTVTGVGNDETVAYTLVKEVAISPLDIEGATVTLNPSSVTYDGKEHTVSCTIKKNNLTATFDFAEGSVTSATAIGEYTVTMDATGNFTGYTTATWYIVNTTGSLSGITSAVSGIGDYDSENNTLTVTDSTALEYSDGAWYAGLTLTWPMTALNVSLNPLRDGSADYVKPEKMQLTIDGNVYTGSEILSGEAVYSAGKLAAKVSTDTYKYYESVFSQPTKQFEYLATTTWKVALTPAIIEAALANDEDELVYTMNAGAFVWEDGREGDSDGVAFADYKITLSLDEPVEFVLGEGESYDLGDTELTTTKIQLAAGASVTCDVVQAEGLIYTEVNGYDVVCSEDGGKYVYTAILTHVHDWSASVAENGYELVATCANDECDINAGVVKMWLDVGTTEKVYDSKSVTRQAVYGDGFKTVYPDSTNVVLTVNGVKDGVINNAGEYDVVLTVNGVGEETYTLSRKVTISKVDISEATLVLTPATTTYNGKAQTVSPSVTVGGVTATLNDGLVVVEGSTCSATDIDTYSVTVEGTGNFTGTASANWSIVNTTGAPTSVTASPSGSMTASGNDFTLSDSSKLEYDADNEVWYAGITIAWPKEKKDSWTAGGYAHYVKEASVRVTSADGLVSHVTQSDKFRANLLSGEKDFTYVATTTWKVPLTPAIIEAAIAEEKASLAYTMNAGAFIWGDDTEGDPDGVAFTDYTITIPLEGITLYDGDGNQVYPKPEGQTIIEDIKDDIGDVVSDPEVAESAKAKIDLLAGVAGEGNEQAVADWVNAKKGEDAATFFEALANSEYVEASFELGTTSLISDESDVEVAEFESTDGGFTLAVTIDEKNIDAERIQQLASIIWSATSLGGESEFKPLVPGRVSVEGGKVIVSKDANADCEFFKIMISKDSAE